MLQLWDILTHLFLHVAMPDWANLAPCTFRLLSFFHLRVTERNNYERFVFTQYVLNVSE